MGDVGLIAPLPYPSYVAVGGEVGRRGYGIGVEVIIGVVMFLLARLKAGMPAEGICGWTGTYSQQRVLEMIRQRNSHHQQ